MQSVYGIYVAALPSEYELEIRELNRNQVLDRNENLVQAQYDLLGKKKKSSPAAHALVVDGRGGSGGRGHPVGKRGSRGGGRGYNGNRKVKKSSDGNDGAEDDNQLAKWPMCYNCCCRGHFARDCTVKLCKRYHGKGLEEDKFPCPADMKAHLTIEFRTLMQDRRLRAKRRRGSWKETWTLRGVDVSQTLMWHQVSVMVAVQSVV